MRSMDYKKLIESKEYDFLRTNEHLGDKIILLGLVGSWAYGTNIKDSDVDCRGCALNSKEELLTNKNFEQFVNEETDTVIYSFNKLITLLSNCNPNTIEILGLKPEHYLYLSEIGKELIDNADMFLSKKAAFTFGAYARSQLNRLINRSGRLNDEIAENECRSIEKSFIHLRNRHKNINKDSFKVFVEDDKIILDMNYDHMAIEEIMDIQAELSNIHNQYKKSTRNQKAISSGKLAKHSMHLIRLYMMGIDILTHHEIRTYRDGDDHKLLMNIRSGKYLHEDGATPTKEFEVLINEYQSKFEEAEINTSLPDKPDYKRINDFLFNINYKIVKGEI